MKLFLTVLFLGNSAYGITLKQAITMGVSHSYSIKAEESRLQRNEYRSSRVVSEFYPKLQVEGSLGTFSDRQVLPGEVAPPAVRRDRNQYQLQAAVVQNLFNGRAHVEELNAAEAEQQEISASLLNQRQLVKQDIIRLYAAIQKNDADLSAEGKVEEILNAQLKDVKRRYRQGRATQYEEIEVQIEIEKQKPTLKELQYRKLQLETELAVKLGQPTAKPLKLSEDMMKYAETLPNPRALQASLQLALKSNPELNESRLAVKKLHHERLASVSDGWPRVDLRFTAQTIAQKRNEVLEDDTISFGGELVFTIPIFSGLSSFADREQIQLAKQELETRSLAIRDRIFIRLHSAYAQWESAKELMNEARSSQKLTRKATDRVKALYRLGQKDLRDVLASYRDSVDAQRRQFQAAEQKILALATIQNLTGQ
ncbi:TolC family protein [Oligoflexaceae bacterium]|nr:TolC family protein [Oligoflexaceae bacterium]